MARPVEVLQPRGRLQLLEAGVGEMGELLVVAGEDHGVAREVGRVAVVVEVVEVGEQEHGLAGVDLGPGRLPGVVVALLEGAQLQRRPGQLAEVLLQPRGAAVEPAAGRGVLEGDVVEAGAGAEAERHLLADLDAVEAEQVAQGGRAAVVAGGVGVAGDRGHVGRILTERPILRPRHGEADLRAAAADAHPRAHARAWRELRKRWARPGTTARSGRCSVSFVLAADRFERGSLADLRAAGADRDRAQLRDQVDRQAAAAGAGGAAAAGRGAQLAQLPVGPCDAPRSPSRRR